MKLNISENLRRLRRINELTQEELAREIGVSFQAVSKWECDDGYPDITLLPVLANFFGVSLDELCGYHEQAKEEQITEIINTYREKYEKNYSLGEEAVAYMLDSHRKFPNDDRITVLYLQALFLYCPRDDERYSEVKPLCEKILSGSTDDAVRKDVYQILFQSVSTEEERMEVAKRRGLSEYDYDSLWWIYQKSDREKYMYYRQWDIIQKYWDLWSLIYWYHEEFENPEDQIDVIERSLKLDYAMFDRSDIAAYAAPPNIYEDLVRRLLIVGRTEDAMKYLRMTVENLEQMKRTEDKAGYDSNLLSWVKYRNCTGWYKEVYEAIKNEHEYDTVRNRQDFCDLCERAEKLIIQNK